MIAIKKMFEDIEEENRIKNEVFLYLEELRESGETNMFGAAAYIQNEFNLDKKTSIKYLSDWMRSYNKQEEE
tara:strand:- start:5499 stop:5714 length:216 start_codon:yes stop_codon:yes gene_type:complete